MATEAVKVIPYADAPGIFVGDNKRQKTMATVAEKVTGYADAPCIFVGDNKRRILDVYYTNQGTKLFVENGALVEERTQSSPFPGYQFAPLQLVPPSLPGLSQSHPKVEPLSPSHKASYQAQNRRTAEAALKYYNSKHCPKFSLLNPISSNGHLLDCGIWYHCNFKAKPEGHEDSSAKLFFAEMKAVESGKQYMVTACCPVDDDSKTTKDCKMCKKGTMVHPTSGHRHGL